jgi:hypothetical protein
MNGEVLYEVVHDGLGLVSQDLPVGKQAFINEVVIFKGV